MHSEFADRNVVITGGTGGLGRAVVAALVDRGAICHLPSSGEQRDRDDAPGDDRISVTGGVDLTDDAAVRAYYQSLPPLWASIHLVGGFAMAPIVDTALADLDAMWRINVATCFACCREATRAIRLTGDGGRIVNIAARPAVEPAPGMIAYAASKAAIAAITRSLAAELRDDHILVNAVLPSLFDTPQNRAAMPDADHDSWPKPAQIAESVAFLASPRNPLTSGSLVPVYGRM